MWLSTALQKLRHQLTFAEVHNIKRRKIFQYWKPQICSFWFRKSFLFLIKWQFIYHSFSNLNLWTRNLPFHSVVSKASWSQHLHWTLFTSIFKILTRLKIVGLGSILLSNTSNSINLPIIQLLRSHCQGWGYIQEQYCTWWIEAWGKGINFSKTFYI